MITKLPAELAARDRVSVVNGIGASKRVSFLTVAWTEYTETKIDGIPQDVYRVHFTDGSSVLADPRLPMVMA